MTFLTFENLFNKNIHINKLNNIQKFDNKFYKIFKNSCIVNLTYTSICLYKLYKIFYFLSSKNIYSTIVNTFKLYNKKYISLLYKFTNNNLVNSKNRLRGYLTNSDLLDNVFLVILWVKKCYKDKKYLTIPRYILKIKHKMENFCKGLKFKKFSKFIFLFNLNSTDYFLNECVLTDRFIMGICGFNTNYDVVDFCIYSNNMNEVSLNFVIKIIITASINGQLNQPSFKF